MVHIAQEILLFTFSFLQIGKNEGLDGGSELAFRKPFAVLDVLHNLLQHRIILESLIHCLFGR